MRRVLREAFDREWQAASSAYRAGDFDGATLHFERAHVLGQRVTHLHVRSHWGLLTIGWQRRSAREVIGQVFRLFAALLFSRVWVPEGNTGGTNVSAFRKMPIPDDLRETLHRDADVG